MQRAIPQQYSRRATPVQVRLSSTLFEAVENWRRGQGQIPSRPEAIRRWLQKSLPTVNDASLARRQAS
jgi:hypothetical protein